MAKQDSCVCVDKEDDDFKFCKVFVPYMDSALNMDTTNTFKSKKIYRHMALHVREEKQLKR